MPKTSRDSAGTALRRSRASWSARGRSMKGCWSASGSAGATCWGRSGRHAQWTSSATHAVLPLLATDAGIRAQVQTGVDSHRARFDSWNGGFWLPECGHAPYLEPLLEEAGVKATCVELTNRWGLGAREHLRAYMGESGVVLVPIDRATIARVWSDEGYPAHGSYRDYHHHTVHHHNPWANNGEAYEHDLALDLAREHAKEFVAATIQRLRAANETDDGGSSLPGGGLVVCALDTELLGHWWYEGVTWLRAVVEECAGEGLPLVRVDEATALQDPAPVESPDWEASTWGSDGDLSTWSGPAVADIAFADARGRAAHGGCRSWGGRGRRARAAGIAGKRLGFHGLTRPGRTLRARALRGPPRRAGACTCRRAWGKRGACAQHRRVRRARALCSAPKTLGASARSPRPFEPRADLLDK